MENKVKWNVSTTVEKFNTHQDYIDGKISEINRIDGNLLLDGGVTDIWKLVAGETNQGGSTEHYDNDHSYIGVGDSTTVASASQTGLQALTNIWYKKMDTSYPTVATNKITFKSTFTGTGGGGDAEAAFAWEEWSIARGVITPSEPLDDTTIIASEIYKNLNRKVESMGTKSSAATWVITVEISLT
jgi:hypothetical protein